MSKDGLGYARYSQHGDASIEKQIEFIESFAEERGWNVEILNEGYYESGFDDEREKYLVLKERIPEIDVVITKNARRLVRDFDEAMRLILLLREHDVEVYTQDVGQLDLSDPVSVAVEVMKAGVDHERKTGQIERAKEAIEKRQEDGCFQGQPPFGLRFAEDKCHLEPDPDEWEKCIEVWDSDAPYHVEGIADKTAYRVDDRGKDWYENKLIEYGL